MSRIVQIVHNRHIQATLRDIENGVIKVAVVEPPKKTNGDLRRKENYNLELKPLFGERNEGETDNAVVACNDFLRMGNGRKHQTLLQLYLHKASQGEAVPTTGTRTLYEWSSKHNWAERCSMYDANVEQIKTDVQDKILQSGLAKPNERVLRLKALAEKLEEQVYDEEQLWLKDYKQIGSGKYAEKIEIIRFNSPLVEQFRATLDDLAKETGGRVRLVSSPPGEPILLGAMDVNTARNRIAQRFEQLASGSNPENVVEAA